MTISYVAGSGVDNTATGRTTTIAVPYVGVPAGGEVRIGILTVEAGPAGAGTLNAIPGWTALTPFSGGIPNGGGHLFDPHTILPFYRVFNGTETGDVTVSIASGFNGISAVMDVYETDQASWEVPALVPGAESDTHANDRSTALDAAADLTAGDWVHMMHGGDRGSAASAFSGASIAQAGATFGAVTIRSTQRSNTGTDALVMTATAEVTVGSNDVPTLGYTLTYALCGPSGLLVLRGSDVEPEEPLIITLTGIPAPDPAVSPDLTVESGDVELGLTGIMSEVNFGVMALEQGIGVTLTGIPAPSPAVNPALVLFREGEEPQHIILDGIAPPASQFGAATQVTVGTMFDGPPCNWPILPCGDEWDTFDVALRERAARYAVETLWRLSGRRYGMCPVTVRPCQPCQPTSYQEWGVLVEQGSPTGSWLPYIDVGGNWRNMACGCADCGYRSAVWLPGPVYEVTSVVVDGVTLDPAAYRVDDGVWLVRQDGGTFPDTQDLNLPAGEAGTFTVTYTRGPAVPLGGQIAAGALALEFARYCSGADCALSRTVQSITRQGVTMELMPDEPGDALTGVAEADMWLKSVNPNRLRQRPKVLSLDVPGPHRTTWGA